MTPVKNHDKGKGRTSSLFVGPLPVAMLVHRDAGDDELNYVPDWGSPAFALRATA
jgi:hypothetical protein